MVLASVKGKLTRDIQLERKRMSDYQNEVRGKTRKANAAHRREEAELLENFVDLETVVSSESPVRADVFREMIMLSQTKGRRTYSEELYHAAAALLFRSRSGYEFMAKIVPLPAPSSVYEHFRERLQECKARLKSLDQVEPFLRTQIAHHPELAHGAVLAVDAVSCTNTFISMKHVEEGKVAYLFLVYLQPLTPHAKCSPLFLIES